MNKIKEVYTLIRRQNIRYALKARELAGNFLPDDDETVSLALHEAILYCIDSFLTELAEHGSRNISASDIDWTSVNIENMVLEFRESHKEAKRFRNSGKSSANLINIYVGDWMFPIGSREWLSQMQRMISWRDESWIARVKKNLP